MKSHMETKNYLHLCKICTMKDQLIKFMTSENITATTLADEIGVQRSSISHILSGRNKPSYDFIIKILNRYNNLNAEWLLTGIGTMYKTNNGSKDTGNNQNPNLFTSLHKENNEDYNASNLKKDNISSFTTNSKLSSVTNVNNIERIVIFFADGKFKEYTP